MTDYNCIIFTVFPNTDDWNGSHSWSTRSIQLKTQIWMYYVLPPSPTKTKTKVSWLFLAVSIETIHYPANLFLSLLPGPFPCLTHVSTSRYTLLPLPSKYQKPKNDQRKLLLPKCHCENIAGGGATHRDHGDGLSSANQGPCFPSSSGHPRNGWFRNSEPAD